MTYEWHDDELDGGTLELHERYTAPAPALELRVVVVGDGRIAALWLTEEGRVLGEAEVGQA